MNESKSNAIELFFLKIVWKVSTKHFRLERFHQVLTINVDRPAYICGMQEKRYTNFLTSRQPKYKQNYIYFEKKNHECFHIRNYQPNE